MNHPARTFCFAELHTPDIDRYKKFYSDLFGWRAVQVAPHFHVFQLLGKDVIGLRQSSTAHRLIGYVKVDSVDQTLARAQQLGASIDTPPFDTRGIARTCVIKDPDGAAFGLWEERGHGGAHVQDQTGAMWWVELMARDIVDARHFYTGLFGWDFSETLKYGGPRPYTIFKVGESSAAGAGEYDPEWGITQRWTVFFAIDDWDATVKKVAAVGGEVIFWRDVPHAGRLGVIQDPACAHFIVMRPLAGS